MLSATVLAPASFARAPTRPLTKGVYPRRFAKTRCSDSAREQDRLAPRCGRRHGWVSRRRDGRVVERERRRSATEQEFHARGSIPRSTMAAGRGASCTRRRKPRLSAAGVSDWRAASATYAGRRWPAATQRYSSSATIDRSTDPSITAAR